MLGLKHKSEIRSATYDVVEREASDDITSNSLHIVESVIALVLVLQMESIKVFLKIEANVSLAWVWVCHLKLEV